MEEEVCYLLDSIGQAIDAKGVFYAQNADGTIDVENEIGPVEDWIDYDEIIEALSEEDLKTILRIDPKAKKYLIKE